MCGVLLFWVAALSLQVVCRVASLRRPTAPGAPRHYGSLVLSAVGAVAPAATLVLFAWVFVGGRSSNVAQFAADGGLGLWRLWSHAWPVLLLGNGASVLMNLAALSLPPYPSADGRMFASRVCGVVAAGSAVLVLIGLAPDA
jgi:hypothetical protein